MPVTLMLYPGLYTPASSILALSAVLVVFAAAVRTLFILLMAAGCSPILLLPMNRWFSELHRQGDPVPVQVHVQHLHIHNVSD